MITVGGQLKPSSYVIGDHFEGFIKQQIQHGRYASASEVIRDGLRALEDQQKFRDMKLEWLRSEVQKGMDSCVGRSIEEVADELKTRYQQWSEKDAPVDAL
jgi:antitoxin ParD1/3/4